MKPIRATLKVQVWGSKNAWSTSQPAGSTRPSKEVVLELEIQGDPKTGYHLIMSPEGFFTADTWYETKEEALEDALEGFGVGLNDWSEVEDE